MKHLTSIIGINFILLLLAIIVLKFTGNFDNQNIYLIPVFAFTVINIVCGLIFYAKKNKSKSRSFLLSSLLILIIGTSSCVSIKFKKKREKKKKKPPTEQPVVEYKKVKTSDVCLLMSIQDPATSHLNFRQHL